VGSLRAVGRPTPRRIGVHFVQQWTKWDPPAVLLTKVRRDLSPGQCAGGTEVVCAKSVIGRLPTRLASESLRVLGKTRLIAAVCNRTPANALGQAQQGVFK
jgi:hypothetical protein